MINLEIRIGSRPYQITCREGQEPHYATLTKIINEKIATAESALGSMSETRLLMFATQPSELLANRSFLVKMGLLAAAGCNAAWFHARGSLRKLDLTARLLMLLSTAIWLGVVFCGRWIAY